MRPSIGRGLSALCAAALCVLALGSPGRAAEPSVQNRDGIAVIVGNRSYTGKIPAVEYAHNDAAAMKAYVTDVLGYRPGNVIDLRDATKAQLEATFGDERNPKGKLFSWVRPGRSDVVVFYSGHGVPGLKDRRGYLLPVDGDANLAELTGYPLDTLYANLRKIPARSVTVFIDACFSGDTQQGLVVKAVSGISVEAKPVEAKGLTVLTAGRGDQVASWDEEAKHGLFTEHLLRALYGRADGKEYGNGDGRVTLGEVRKYLDEEMTYQARRRFTREQNPTIAGADTLVLASFAIGVPPKRPVLAYVAPESKRPIRYSKSMGDAAAGETSLDLWPYERVLVQRALNGLKLDAGPADGLFGPKTRDAIRMWQRSKGLGETGYLTRDQAEALSAAGQETKVAVGVFPQPVAPRPSGPRPGETFRDCPECPEMVVVPAGSFLMGSPESEPNRENDEGPVHRVTIPRAFGVGKYEVTKGEYAAFVRATGRSDGDGCHFWNASSKKLEKDGSRSWRSPGYGQTERDPVACVSWDEAQAYVRWLSEKTGQGYRLLSEAEWEYAARAGTTTAYSMGSGITTSQANFDNAHGKTVPVGSYRPNGFGLYDMHGNVFEWVEDCWKGSYGGAPSDGSAWTSGVGTRCGWRVLRGGSWLNSPRNLRSANRGGFTLDFRVSSFGFRVARTN